MRSSSRTDSIGGKFLVAIILLLMSGTKKGVTRILTDNEPQAVYNLYRHSLNLDRWKTLTDSGGQLYVYLA